MDKLMGLFREAVQKVRFYKYAWVLIITIVVLTLIGYFQLRNLTVFVYAVAVLLITYLGFVFHAMTNLKDRFIKALFYVLAFSIIVTVSLAISGFALFIFTEKPKFYKRLLPDLKDSTIVKVRIAEDSLYRPSDQTIRPKESPTIEKNISRRLTKENLPSTDQPPELEKNKSNKISIAVLPFAFYSKDSSYAWLTNGIPETITTKISQIERYAIIEGVQRNRVLDEINFQQGRYIDPKTAVAIGKMMGAKQILIGSCQLDNNSIHLSSRVVVVESGIVLKESAVSLTGIVNNIYETEQNFADTIYNALHK